MSRRWTLRLLAAVGLAAGGVAAGRWWITPDPTGPRPLTIVVSGDTAGWLIPCGCTTNQSGGLPRRGTYLRDAAPGGDVLYLDAGGAAGGTSAYHRATFEAILRGERAMGVAAHNVGRAEAALGADYLRRTAAGLGVPFVSANVRDAAGEPVAPRVHVVDRAGRRVAVTGVLSPKYAAPGLVIDDPRDAVLRVAAKNAGKYDALVVLAYLPEDDLRRFAATVPEADAVVGGPTGQSIAPTPAGRTAVAAATNKGKFLVRFDVPEDRTPWTGEVIELTEKWADDAEQLANVRAYLAELGRVDFAANETDLVPPPPAAAPTGYRVAGSVACRACHPADSVAWDSSKHAHSWPSLTRTGSHVDPSCQQCHSTGYGLPGGFVSVAKVGSLGAVGCESCHGPSQAHVADPKQRTPFAARDQCVTCHDKENSPLYTFDAYWPKVRHGGREP